MEDEKEIIEKGNSNATSLGKYDKENKNLQQID